LVKKSWSTQTSSAHIVSKDVLYELFCIVWNDLVKDRLPFLETGTFELLLDEARAVLVTTKLNDVVLNLLRDSESIENLQPTRETHLQIPVWVLVSRSE